MSKIKSVRSDEAVPESMAELGSEFRRIRKEKKIGLQEAADRLGLSFGYLARIERGEQKLTSEQIEAFAALYGLSAKDLLEKAGLTSSLSRYIPTESIQHSASFIIKHPLMQGSFHIPTTMEGKAAMVCLFQAFSERRLLDSIETEVTLEWLGFASLEKLQLAALNSSNKFTEVLQKRGSSEEALEDVSKVLNGMPHWAMKVWEPKEDLPKINKSIQVFVSSSMEDQEQMQQIMTHVSAAEHTPEGASRLLLMMDKLVVEWIRLKTSLASDPDQGNAMREVEMLTRAQAAKDTSSEGGEPSN